VAMGPLKEVNFPVPFASHSVLTVHDWHLYADDATPVERFYRGTRRLRFQKRFLRCAAQVVTDSVCVGDETVSRACVAPEKIFVIVPGGDHLDAVVEIPAPEKGFVLSIGDGPHKGLDTAFQALTWAREQGFNRDWVVVGNPDRVQAQLKLSGAMPPWIRVIPAKTDAEIKGLYRAALCLLFPSRHEGFGFPPLEAMRLGCPVLATDIEPLRSLIQIPESLLPAGDAEGFAQALLRLSREADFHNACVNQGIIRAKDHTWNRTADQVLGLWDRLLDRSNP
jgi:glycosyltransferase involved in cell wall biosynthesis